MPTVADDAIFKINSAANTDAHVVNLNGPRQVRSIVSFNDGATDSVGIFGGNGNQTLSLGVGGITHNRSAMNIGSVTDGQKVNISLLGSQIWNSNTSAGGGTAVALQVYNDTTAAVDSTLTLAGINTGTTIHGGLGDGAGVLSLTKLGTTVNVWTLNGPVTYSGPTTVSAGILRLNNTVGLNTNQITMAGGTTLGLAVGGSTGMPVSKLRTLLSTGSFAANTTFELNATGAVFLPYNIPLESNLTKTGSSELTLLGLSGRTSITAVNSGTLRLRDLQPGGVPSSIGASSNAATNLTFGSGSRLIYDGPGATTDRLFTYSGNLTIESAGSGPLQFTNTGSFATGTANSRTVTLIGSNQGDNRIRASLGTNVETSLTKRGGGNWTILGSNVFTGTSRVDEGTLTYDFSAGEPFQSATLLLNGGTMVLRGTGSTAKSITTLNLGTPAVSSSRLKLENGFALSATSLTAGATTRNDLIDLSGNANNSLTVGGLSGSGSNLLTNVNGIIMTGSTGNGRAGIVLRAQNGSYGFLSLSGGTSGTAQKAAPLTQLSPGTLSMSSDSTNYILKTGDYAVTPGQNLVFSTLTLDSSDGPILLDLRAEEIKPSGQGKALLFTGDHSVEIKADADNNDAGDDTAIWYHNYLEAGSALNFNVGLGRANQTVIFGGSGLTVYGGQGFVGTFLVNDGIFRCSKNQSVVLGPLSPIFKIGNGAVLEVGAKLNTANTDADLVKTMGGGAGGIRFYGDAGLSAYNAGGGGKRIAQFSTITRDPFFNAIITPQLLTWGSDYFLTISENEPNSDGDNAFKLSSNVSNAMIEVRNTIFLNGKSRTLDVADGSEVIDARMSGSLMGLSTPGDTASGIVKKGPGTLQLSGVNMYKGETRVMEGTLMIDTASLDAQSRLWIDSGAKLHVSNASGAVHVAEVYIDGVQYFGTVTHPSIIGGGTLISDTPITPYGQWVIDKALGTTESAPTFDADLDGIRNLVEYAVGSEPKTVNGSVLSITGGAPRQIKFKHASGRTDVIFVLESSPNLSSPWTIVARSLNGAAFTSAATNVVVSEVSNQVTVTDNRTPAATVMFYRLRVEK